MLIRRTLAGLSVPRRWLRRARVLLRLIVLASISLSAAFVLLNGLVANAYAQNAFGPGGVWGNLLLRLGAQTPSNPPVAILASLAAIAGSVAVLAVVWLYWTMTTTAKRYQEALGHPDEISRLGVPDQRSIYRLIASLHAKVLELEQELEFLRGSPPTGGRTASTPQSISIGLPAKEAPGSPLVLDELVGLAQADSRSKPRSLEASGPRILPATYWNSHHIRRAPASTPGSIESIPSFPDNDQATSPNDDFANHFTPGDRIPPALEQFERDSQFTDFMNRYRDGIGNPGLLTALELEYAVRPLEWQETNELIATNDADAPYWFVEVADGYGLALPSRTAVLQWPTSFQAAGGARAKGVFGIAYEVREGAVLQVLQPAWIRRNGQFFRVASKGTLSGA